MEKHEDDEEASDEEKTIVDDRELIDYTRVQSVLRPTYTREFNYDGAPICLSWDCGSQNLAYCLFAYNHYKPEFVDTKDEIAVIGWEKINLGESEMGSIVRALHTELNRRSWLLKANNVCIEQQNPNHLKMFAFSYAIMMYFLEATKSHKQSTTEFISASEKFNVMKLSEDEIKEVKRRSRSEDAYKNRKETSIFQAEKILGAFRDERPLAYLARHEKKDDLAESLTQGIQYMRKKMIIKNQTRKIKQIVELNVQNPN